LRAVISAVRAWHLAGTRPNQSAHVGWGTGEICIGCGALAACAHGFQRPRRRAAGRCGAWVSAPESAAAAGLALAGQLLPFTTTYCSVTAGSARLGFRLPFRLHARSDLLQRYYSTALCSPLSPAVWNCGPMPMPTPRRGPSVILRLRPAPATRPPNPRSPSRP
jgi:hypothetical protein